MAMQFQQKYRRRPADMLTVVTLAPRNGRRRDEVSRVSSPFSLVKDARRSAQPTKFEALGVTVCRASSTLPTR
jgi:hypothetical protein